VIAALVALRIWQDRAQPEPWTTQEKIGPALRSFTISIDSGQCSPDSDPVDRVEVEETAGSVTVTAYVDPFGGGLVPPGGTDDCLSRYLREIVLQAPLGDHELRIGGYPGLAPGGPLTTGG